MRPTHRDPPGSAIAAPARRRWRWLRRALVVVASLAAITATAAAVLYASLPGVADAPRRVKAIDRAHGGATVRLPTSARIARAVVAVEDERFFRHGALDYVAVGRVVLSSLSGGSVDPGGSTIAQQLAKALYVAHPETVSGRLRAIGLAFKLERSYSKAQILNLYLNAIYYGHDYYGIAAASHGYFGKSPNQLSWPQAALLAGLPQAPSAYDPFLHLASARRRQRAVLRQLVDNHILSRRDATGARRQPLALRPVPVG